MQRLTARSPSARGLRSQRGLSLVELMIGITVGLIVVAGASFVAVNQISDNHRLTLETQVQQDLRASADVIARDVRRAGYWGAAEAGVWYDGGPATASNPYGALSPDAAASAVQQVDFRYSRGTEDGIVDPDTEQFGFKLEDKAIKMLIGGAWQMLTDPAVVEITRFDVTMEQDPVPAPQLPCFKPCPSGGTSCWPSIDVRRLTIRIDGQAVADARVQRSVTTSARLRNDRPNGNCPS